MLYIGTLNQRKKSFEEETFFISNWLGVWYQVQLDLPKQTTSNLLNWGKHFLEDFYIFCIFTTSWKLKIDQKPSSFSYHSFPHLCYGYTQVLKFDFVWSWNIFNLEFWTQFGTFIQWKKKLNFNVLQPNFVIFQVVCKKLM